jgi:hypothetical protein
MISVGRDFAWSVAARLIACHGGHGPINYHQPHRCFRKPSSLDPAAANLGHKTPKMRCTCRLANQRLLYDQAAEIIDSLFEKRERRRLQSAGPDQGRLVNGPKTTNF